MKKVLIFDVQTESGVHRWYVPLSKVVAEFSDATVCKFYFDGREIVSRDIWDDFYYFINSNDRIFLVNGKLAQHETSNPA